jgi:hypothetical protein
MNQTIWKDINIEKFKNYEASNEGKIRNKITKKEVGYKHNNTGYRRVTINAKPERVHRLVAIAFKPIPLEEFAKLHVHHVDGNKLNNRPENLKYLTEKEHALEEIRLGTTAIGKTGKYSLSFKGTIGRFNESGYLLDVYYGGFDLKRENYLHQSVYNVINGIGKKYRGFFWKRFPKDHQPQIGVKYDMQDPMFKTETQKKKKIKFNQLCFAF